jgi:hypothetical protein
MMLKPSLSFAGPREYRWQGLEVPVMMGKRRGTEKIATASPAGCAASNRHENLLFSQLDGNGIKNITNRPPALYSTQL